MRPQASLVNYGQVTLPRIGTTGLDRCSCVRRSPDGRRVAIAAGRLIHICCIKHESEDNGEDRLLTGDTAYETFSALAWSPCSQYIVTYCTNGDTTTPPILVIWNVKLGVQPRPALRVTVPAIGSLAMRLITALAWSDDGTRIAAASAHSGVGASEVVIFSVDTAVLRVHLSSQNSRLPPNCVQVMSGSSSNPFAVPDVPSSMQFCLGTSLLLVVPAQQQDTVSRGEEVRMFDTATGRQKWATETESSRSEGEQKCFVAWTDRAQRLVFTVNNKSNDLGVRVWDLMTGEEYVDEEDDGIDLSIRRGAILFPPTEDKPASTSYVQVTGAAPVSPMRGVVSHDNVAFAFQRNLCRVIVGSTLFGPLFSAPTPYGARADRELGVVAAPLDSKNTALALYTQEYMDDVVDFFELCTNRPT